MSTALRTRFAPSPTGHLHLGNARTALLNFLAARKSGGRFVLRVEDTDEARSDEGLMRQLLEDLRWLGLTWDEGPDVEGPHAPYRQSERRAIHEKWLGKLSAAGLTYPCFCTPLELSIARKQQLTAGKPPRYPGTCRELTEAQVAERLAGGQAAAIRFRVPAGRIVEFTDLVHGPQRFATDDIGDFIIRRTDGSTAFFFSNAIDDALMGITTVLRGDDHLANTPRQILLLEALRLPIPRYGHVALLLGMDGAPLSKRHGALSLGDLRRRGYLPAAIRNHLLRLGHTCSTDRWLDDAAMLEEFDLARLGRAPARFDEVQLRHWQKEGVAQLSEDEFRAWVAADVPAGLPQDDVAAFCRAIRGNVEFPGDARLWAEVVFGTLPPLAAEAETTVREAGAEFFATAAEVLDGAADFKSAVRQIGQRTARKGPALYMPLRAALTGLLHGPELGPLLALLPQSEVRARLERARSLAQA